MLTVPLPDPATIGEPPAWIELIPAGPDITGHDGRNWINDSPDSIVSAFAQRGTPLLLDYEHASEHRAPHGLDAPAAGWIDRLEVRAGAIWGHIERWTDRALASLRAREYRYISPVFQYEKTSGRIRHLVSAALTNVPNLRLTALNQARFQPLVLGLTAEERQVARLFGKTEAEALEEKRADAAEATARNAATRHAAAYLTPEERRLCEVMNVDPADFTRQKEEYRHASTA